MRSMVESDSDSEDQRDAQGQTDPEVTLGMPALLGIFFGLVILCGVFFGFGYSIGHRSGSPATSSHANAASAQPAINTTETAADTTDESGPDYTKPSPNSSAPTLAPAPAVAARPARTAAAEPTPSQPAADTTSSRSQPAVMPYVSPSAASPVSGAPLTGAVPGAFMVQIAAVSRPEDGQALIAALRKHGYNVSARSEPQDKLLHVQVGPFATRAEANAMRQKLLSDGYNAIIK